MSFPHWHDIRDLLLEGSEKNRHLSTTVGSASKADRSKLPPDESPPTRLTFLEDFTLEHSLYGMRTK